MIITSCWKKYLQCTLSVYKTYSSVHSSHLNWRISCFVAFCISFFGWLHLLALAGFHSVPDAFKSCRFKIDQAKHEESLNQKVNKVLSTKVILEGCTSWPLVYYNPGVSSRNLLERLYLVPLRRQKVMLYSKNDKIGRFRTEIQSQRSLIQALCVLQPYFRTSI